MFLCCFFMFSFSESKIVKIYEKQNLVVVSHIIFPSVFSVVLFLTNIKSMGIFGGSFFMIIILYVCLFTINQGVCCKLLSRICGRLWVVNIQFIFMILYMYVFLLLTVLSKTMTTITGKTVKNTTTFI